MPTNAKSTVVAVFRNRSEAEAAASDLRANGFASSDIYLSSDKSAVDAAGQPGGVYSDADTEPHQQHEGGIVGWFKSVFGQEEHGDRGYYEDAVNTGHSFLSVDVTADSVDRAANVLNGHNPIDIHREEGTENAASTDALAKAPPTGAVPAYGAGVAVPDARATAAAPNARATAAANTDAAIPVVREELKVGKRSVLKGGVRVYSRMVEEPVQETVRLHEEKVRVDRTPVNREATAADLKPGREQVFEVKEFAEEAVVSKQARVVEEVRVHKDATEHTETINENVRHTEVNVENVEPGTRARAASAMASPTAATGTTAGTALGANEEDFRRHFTSTYGNSGGDYETYRPGYDYGYQMANDPRYRDRSFEDVEPQLRTDYASRYPNSTWDRTKDAVRYGWNKVTGKV